MNKQFVSLHIGLEEVTAIAAHWTRNGDYVIDGFYRANAKGLREGIVTNATDAANSILKCLNGIKEKTGSKFREVYAGVTAPSIDIMSTSGDILLSRYGREVTAQDIKKCVEIGSVVRLPLDREPLHRMVDKFSVDGQKNISNPINLAAVKLGVRMNILTINSSLLSNITKCINMAGFLSSGFVFSGLASSYRVLTEEEKSEGVALLRICRKITEILFFYNGVMTNCKVISVGTDDIVTGDSGMNRNTLSELSSEIVSLSRWGEIKKVVVTGEGSMLDDMLESLESLFNLPVKVASCSIKLFENLPEDRGRYIVNLGILDHLYKERQKRRVADDFFKNAVHRVVEFADKYF